MARLWILRTFLLIVPVAIMVQPSVSLSQWVINGASICTTLGSQDAPQLVSDGAGGGIIVWSDMRSGEYDIYVQRVDIDGVAQWAIDGLAICSAPERQYCPEPVSDGAGGAIVTWHDRRGGVYDIYAQRVDATGAILWTPDGVAICTALDIQQYPQIISDGAGGAIITWYDRRDGNYDIYAQRVDATGTPQWTTDGVAMSTASEAQQFPQLIPDGSGGAIIAWEDNRTGFHDIYAQRVDATGVVQWTSDGLEICTASGDQHFPQLISDGSGGAIITWEDTRNGTCDIYAQRVDSTGAIQWSIDGIAVCTALNDQHSPQLASDGVGGAIITWYDWRSDHTDIYAQRVDAAGTIRWTPDGVPICTESGGQVYLLNPNLTSDGSGGAIIAWEDSRGGDFDIYAQRVDSTGTVLWMTDGVKITTAPEPQFYPQLVPDGANGAIITWEDIRSGDWDIYCQRVNRDGYAPPVDGIPPQVVSPLAVVLTTESSVTLAWTAPGDDDTVGTAATYDIRYSTEGVGSDTSAWWEAADTVADEPAPSPAGDWDSCVVSGLTMGQTYYFAIKTADEVPNWSGISNIASAIPHDGVPPQAITSLMTISAVDSFATLSWIAPGDDGDTGIATSYDIRYSSEAIGMDTAAWWEAADTVADEPMPSPAGDWDSCVVSGLTMGQTYYFAVKTADEVPNWSGISNIVSAIVVGVEEHYASDLPRSFSLSQNFPNPCNPATVIQYELPGECRVRLEVYNVFGQRVRTLVDGLQTAGSKYVQWNGRDERGQKVASGVYLYRLHAEGHELARRMVLCR